MEKKLCVKLSLLVSILISASIFVGNASLNAGSNSNVNQSDSTVKLVVDVDNLDKLPKNFRKTDIPVPAPTSGTMPKLDGLSSLNASGSGTFSEKGLELLKKQIGANYKIIDIDLRQETHGYVNGMSISWYGKNDDENIGLEHDEVVKKGEERLKSLKKMDVINFDLLPNDKSVDKGSVKPEVVESEKDMVGFHDIGYCLLTVPDHYKPDDKEVNRFIELVKDLHKDEWLHFHCRGGVGRTTTFMILYDMMRNADKVSCDDIINRQALIGGKNLSDDIGGKDDPALNQAALDREKFIRQFYLYCVDNIKNNFKKSWKTE
jgi:hypothetical protein